MVFRNEGSQPVVPTKDLLSWIFDQPRYDAKNPIYIDPSNPLRSISNEQARVLVRQLVAGFHNAGLKKGDGVLLHSFNDIYYPIIVLGVIAAGGVFTGSNPSYTQYELTHQVKTADVKFIISEPQISKHVLGTAREVGLPPSNVWAFDEADKEVPAGMQSWRALLEHGEKDWLRFDDLKKAQHTEAARLFSSGTTGPPKATSLSHYNFIAQHTLAWEYQQLPYQMVRLVPLPIFHAAAAPMTHTSALRDGVRTYIMRRFDLPKYCHYSLLYSVTDLFLVPPMAVAIANSPVAASSFFKSVKAVNIGAAPLDSSVQALLRTKLPANVPVTQMWGMTETSCIGFLTPWPEHDDTGSVGRLIPCLEAKLIDENGKDISGYDVRGELCLRGPTIINGYYKNSAANEASFDKDGWFMTGDVFTCAKSTGKWYIVDRKKELIKVRGFQVSPSEIEGVLVGHPSIIDAAVVGVRLPSDEDEHPRAYIKTQDGATVTEEEVKEFVGSKLAKYKSLTGGVQVVSEIPRNASGKILKAVLREQAKQTLGRTGKL